MSTTNCLQGVVCPKCGQAERFHVTVLSSCVLTDDGTDYHQDCYWDSDSAAMCGDPACGFDGVMRDFDANNPANVLDRIQLVLSENEWSTDTVDAIAQLVRGSGREIKDFPPEEE